MEERPVEPIEIEVKRNDQKRHNTRTSTKKGTRRRSIKRFSQYRHETLHFQNQITSEIQTTSNSVSRLNKNNSPLIVCPINPAFFNGMKCYYSTEPMIELIYATKASIRQRFEPWEVISNCETPNQYYVFVKDANQNDKYLFKAKEESTWCCRNCSPESLREFVLNLKTIIPLDKEKSKKQDYAQFNRPYKCTCCCFNRPVMTGKLKNDKSFGDIGRIVQDFSLCDPHIQIYDREGKGCWSITCDCCQTGYCCSNTPCGKCSEVDFEIHHGVGKVRGIPSGTICKTFRGLASLISDSDLFDITFPEKATPEEKFLLIAAVIMLDYMYYEDKNDSIQPGQHKVLSSPE